MSAKTTLMYLSKEDRLVSFCRSKRPKMFPVMEIILNINYYDLITNKRGHIHFLKHYYNYHHPKNYLNTFKNEEIINFRFTGNNFSTNEHLLSC